MFTKLPLYPYLKRDLNNYIATRYGNQTAVDILMATPDIEIFQNTMLGADINLGVHGGGHFSLDPALLDFFASPSDPAFFLHHSNIDRVWTLWQAQNPGKTVCVKRYKHHIQWQLNTTSYARDGAELGLSRSGEDD